MKSHNHLAKQFLASKPAEAARVLEELSELEAAALLTRVPARLAGPVLNEMLPPNAAAIASQLAPDKFEALLPLLSNICAAALLRAMPSAKRSRHLRQLPRLRAKMLQLMLNHAATSVGAWMDTHVFTLPESSVVAQAFNRVRRTNQVLGQKIYVLDREHRLIGEVGLPLILQQPEEVAIATLMQPVSDALRARASLTSVVDHVGWRENITLPVVDHQRVFIGLLSRTTLDRALASQAAQMQSSPAPTSDGLGRVIWLTLLGACQVGASVVATDKTYD